LEPTAVPMLTVNIVPDGTTIGWGADAASGAGVGAGCDAPLLPAGALAAVFVFVDDGLFVHAASITTSAGIQTGTPCSRFKGSSQEG